LPKAFVFPGHSKKSLVQMNTYLIRVVVG